MQGSAISPLGIMTPVVQSCPKPPWVKDGRETGAEPVPREGRREVRTLVSPS